MLSCVCSLKFHRCQCGKNSCSNTSLLFLKQLSIICNLLLNGGTAACNLFLNLLVPKISLVILLTVCHTIFMMLVLRIWYWIY